MKLKSSVIFAIGMVALLSGCVSTNAAMLGNSSAKRAPVSPQNVALYRTASQVPSRYEEIALLNSTGDSNFTNESTMFESMQKKAGEIGANGVILDALSEPSSGAKVAAAIFGVSAQRKGKAIAIYIFPDPTSAVITAPSPQSTGVTPGQSNPGSGTSSKCVSCEKIGKGF